MTIENSSIECSMIMCQSLSTVNDTPAVLYFIFWTLIRKRDVMIDHNLYCLNLLHLFIDEYLKLHLEKCVDNSVELSSNTGQMGRMTLYWYKNVRNVFKGRFYNQISLKTLWQKKKLLIAISPFAKMFFKSHLLQRRQNASICGKGLKPISCFNVHKNQYNLQLKSYFF